MLPEYLGRRRLTAVDRDVLENLNKDLSFQEIDEELFLNKVRQDDIEKWLRNNATNRKPHCTTCKRVGAENENESLELKRIRCQRVCDTRPVRKHI